MSVLEKRMLALKSDLEAFDLWCSRTNGIALPATPESVADYLDARAGQGARPASLGRYKASIAKIHQLLDLKDPTQAELVKLRLRAIRREQGVAQAQARPLRFKGPVRDVERDAPRGLNVRALLDSCLDDLPGLRGRALLSAAYDSGLRASELVAIEMAHLMEALDPEARLLSIPRSKGALGDLTADDLARLLKGVSAHSMRVGLASIRAESRYNATFPSSVAHFGLFVQNGGQ